VPVGEAKGHYLWFFDCRLGFAVGFDWVLVNPHGVAAWEALANARMRMLSQRGINAEVVSIGCTSSPALVC
jgi:hypothetical protein